ncbi:MAG: ATP-binding protein [Planctomycetes bacterium]|nr:ATP-binding protein [Planctomycetota bacterium]
MDSETREIKPIRQTCISEIVVRELFGLYNYNLKPENPFDSKKLFILYGDNGSGKTSILSLVFHLLSPAPARGHRGYIAKTPFREFKVIFNDGMVISAIKTGKTLRGDFTLTIQKRDGISESFNYLTETDGSLSSVNGKNNDKHFLEVLNSHGLSIYYLSDNRELTSDLLSKTEDQGGQEWYFVDPTSGRKMSVAKDKEDRGKLVKDALERANQEIRKKAHRSSMRGELSVNAIYREVVNHLVNPNAQRPEYSIADMLEKIRSIEAREEEYAKYDLASGLQFTEIKAALSKPVNVVISNLVNALLPYLDAVEAKLNALEEVMQQVSKFINSINAYFRDKRISYKLSKGFVIINNCGDELAPGQLSSGEKQLLVLLTSLLFSYGRCRIFVLDEPEISLNTKWQRKIANEWLEFSKDTNVQLIVASHSFDIVSGHLDCVAKLDSTDAR